MGIVRLTTHSFQKSYLWVENIPYYAYRWLQTHCRCCSLMVSAHLGSRFYSKIHTLPAGPICKWKHAIRRQKAAGSNSFLPHPPMINWSTWKPNLNTRFTKSNVQTKQLILQRVQCSYYSCHPFPSCKFTVVSTIYQVQLLCAGWNPIHICVWWQHTGWLTQGDKGELPTFIN